MKGTNAADSLVGTSKADKILALGGDDFVNFSGGNDKIDGGEGFDLVSYQESSQPISVNLRAGTVVVGKQTDKVVNIEMIIGTDGADTFVGARAGDSWFQGGPRG
ncbi:MAG: hypothetical protein KL863_27700 [Rhizobium sp.]|nr:hypothetical protein [Rhizobium sp.]